MLASYHQPPPAMSKTPGDKDLVFLEMFASDEFMDVSLNQWLRRLPTGTVKDHLNFDKAILKKIPAEKRVVL
jgi:oxalate decarboxylase